MCKMTITKPLWNDYPAIILIKILGRQVPIYIAHSISFATTLSNNHSVELTWPWTPVCPIANKALKIDLSGLHQWCQIPHVFLGFYISSPYKGLEETTQHSVVKTTPPEQAFQISNPPNSHACMVCSLLESQGISLPGEHIKLSFLLLWRLKGTLLAQP